MKLIVFDLDNTLCALGERIEKTTMALLKKLQKRGHTLAICSGKPTYYLCGLIRQMGLKGMAMLGENGATAQFGVDLPPKDFYALSFPIEAKQTLERLHKKIDTELNDRVWFQPNEVCVTPFLREEKDFDIVQKIVDNDEGVQFIDVYRHCDCFDFTPKGIDKGQGVEFLAKKIGVCPQDCIAVGDGVNDLPMFKKCGLSIGIGDISADKNFVNIDSALEYLLENV